MVVRSPRSGGRPSFVQSIMRMRTFEASDLPKVIELVEETFSEAYDPDLYHTLSREWPNGLVVAEMGTEVIGFLMATIQRPFQARVLILGIKEGYRGQGVGRALMQAIMNRSIIRGCRNITLEVRVSNERALNFYSRLGFEMIGLIPKFYRDGESAFLLKKML